MLHPEIKSNKPPLQYQMHQESGRRRQVREQTWLSTAKIGALAVRMKDASSFAYRHTRISVPENRMGAAAYAQQVRCARRDTSVPDSA
eukprot:393100-Rhodomonas_salina.2